MSEPTTSAPVRISWTDKEVEHIARAFIREREIDAIGNPIEMLRRAIQLTVDAGLARFRDINTFLAVPDVKAKVETLWLEKMTDMNPAPVVVHVETQKPMDYLDLLDKLDMPSLIALVVSKFGKELEAFKPLLAAMSGTNGHEKVGTPLRPPVSLLAQASSKPRKTRVLVTGLQNRQFQEISRRAEESSIPVDLQFMDAEKSNRERSIPISTDYVIALSETSHPLRHAIQKTVPAGKFFFIQTGGIDATVQKLRDIGAMLSPRA